MGFRGYKFKYKLIVFKNFQDSENPSSVYAKTFELTLLISSDRTKFLRFDEIDAVIEKTLGKYSEKVLEQIPPFDELEPTLENMGNVFYQFLKKDLALVDTSLQMLEISESPVRIFIVNEENTDERLIIRDKKIKVSSLLVENIISQSVSNLISDFEKTDEVTTPVEHIQEPPVEAEAPPPVIPKTIIPIAASTLSSEKVPLYQLVFSFLFLVLCGTLVALYLKNTGAYPSGADIYGHLFKSDLLYHSILKGDLFPLYTDLWYNGVQPFRYWAPLPYYILAILQFFAGGSAATAYLLFVAFAIVVGGSGWLLWGYTYKRVNFCTFLAILWFFMPDNIRVFFVEGNLPRMVIAIFLPYLFYFIWMFVEHHKKWAVIPVVITMCLITVCHAMIAAMTGITTFIFLLIYSMGQKRRIESFYIICAMLLSFAICGVWLFAALRGGLLGMDASATAEVMQALSTPFTTSLNPILRNQGLYEMFYFGVSILILSIIGLLLANKKSRPGFYTVIIVFLGTTPAMVPFLEKLPLNQLFWMTRFTPIAYTLFLISMLEWKKCRRYALILIALIIVMDCVPSLDLQRYHSQTPSVFKYTLDAAKEITKQRLSLLDVSAYGSYPSFGICAEDPQTPYTFGWAWQAASTAHNIVMVNTSLEKGDYHFMFDRSLELGNDTILVRKELVTQAKKSLKDLKEAAEASGYVLYSETNFTYIFHRETPDTFGIETEYKGLAIGSSANTLTLRYPTFAEGYSENLSDYTFDELRKYKVIYLSGFTYDDKKSVQELLLRASKAGVRIIIDMHRIPVDPLTSRMTFFDVTAQSVTFSSQYPELMYRNKIYNALSFKKEYAIWNTVYLENIDSVLGYSWFKNKQLPFIGTSKNKNIIFIGFNLLYHATETKDDTAMNIMSDLLGVEQNKLPERTVIPINVSFEEDKIIINTSGGQISTTLAYQDNFRSEQKIINQNNLLKVVESRTEIKAVYPYLLEGSTLSTFGLFGIVILICIIYRKRGARNEKK